METGRSLLWLSTICIALLVSLSGSDGKICTASSCGIIHNISSPFRLTDDPVNCGESEFELSCESNVTVLHFYSRKYLVQAIDYEKHIMQVIDTVDIQKNNCSLPGFPILDLCSCFPFLSIARPYYFPKSFTNNLTIVSLLNCLNPINSSLYLHMGTPPCSDITAATSSIFSQSKTYNYVMIGDTSALDFEAGCNIEWSMYMIPLNKEDKSFELWWPNFTTSKCRSGWDRFSNCIPYTIAGFFAYMLRRFQEYRMLISAIFGLFFLARFILGVGIWIYKWRIRHLSMYNTIEDFLRSDNNFIPIRYSYSDIKKMTRGFKDKLGEGGYGTVFKAKLRSGRFGAIKMLGKHKANGQEFINEVATIGRIHHVNVVQLIGYCVEGSKCALVYDFMQNGSLEKYIYSKDETVIPMDCDKMFDICLGVAKGIEYLHQGCDMQILRFDIKPHNILLDENFIPKVSDFGLAKLYPIETSIVTLTAARGTMGYIAPELFYKNLGGVSYKADVYSFGMLLMETASRRKNLNAVATRSSQIYFPAWVYDQYNAGNDLEMVPEGEKHIIKKMVITALWCIQLKPDDRPSMKKVIEMLEGNVESLQMPPKPFLCPQQMPIYNVVDNNMDPIGSITELTISTLSGR